MQIEKAVICKASVDDIARLVALAEKMNSYKGKEYFLRQFEYHDEGRSDIYIVQHEDLDAGYCILNWYPKYGFFKKLSIPEIQDLNVIPDMRRKGLAKAMIAHCENAAKTSKYEYMGIGVSVSPQFGPAQKLYGSLGYIPDANGVTYDRKLTAAGEFRPLDDQLCMMMIKPLSE